MESFKKIIIAICLSTTIFLNPSKFGCYASCGKSYFNDDSGVIKYAGYEDDHCIFTIHTWDKKPILLTWNSFSVDEEMPYCREQSVKVYIG